MSELQQHTEKRHQSLTDDVKTSSFFSEANGFWLSIHPENYARLIKPTDHDTILAIRTRAAVSRWLFLSSKTFSERSALNQISPFPIFVVRYAMFPEEQKLIQFQNILLQKLKIFLG
jgi:hypothetical protein